MDVSLRALRRIGGAVHRRGPGSAAGADHGAVAPTRREAVGAACRPGLALGSHLRSRLHGRGTPLEGPDRPHRSAQRACCRVDHASPPGRHCRWRERRLCNRLLARRYSSDRSPHTAGRGRAEAQAAVSVHAPRQRLPSRSRCCRSSRRLGRQRSRCTRSDGSAPQPCRCECATAVRCVRRNRGWSERRLGGREP